MAARGAAGLALALALVVGAALAPGARGAAAPPLAGAAPRGVAWAVQLSDFHISKWAHPEIAPDLEVFGARCAAGGAGGVRLGDARGTARGAAARSSAAVCGVARHPQQDAARRQRQHTGPANALCSPPAPCGRSRPPAPPRRTHRPAACSRACVRRRCC
jgi:hypothetical protein